MTKPNTKSVDGVVEGGNLIARTNRMFVELRRVGELNAKGQVRFARGYKGKIIANPDEPLMLFAALIDQFVLRGFPYSSKEAAAEDVKKFKTFMEELTTDVD